MRNLLIRIRDWFRYQLLRFRKASDAFMDHCRPDGYLELRLIHATGPKKGQVAHVIKGRNIITSWQSTAGAAPTSGRDLVRRILVPATEPGSLAGDASATIQTCKLGSGTTAEEATDTDLETVIGGTEKSLSSVLFDTASPHVTFVWDYAADEANVAISEFGVFSGRGDFFARKTFPSFTNTSDFTLQIRYTLKV